MMVNSLIKRITLLLIILVLSGCATTTQGQRDYRKAHKTIVKSNKDFQACYTKIAKKPKYKVLIDNLAIKGEKADLRALTNEKEFSKDEKNTFLDFYAEHQVCDERKLNNFGEIDGGLQLVFIKQRQVRDKTFLAWIEAPLITYGQMNKDIEKLREEERAQNIKWGNDYSARLDYEHRLELRDREKAREELKASIDATLQEVVDGLIALGKTQNSLAAQQTVVIERNIQPITPVIVNTTCRKFINGTINCTSF